MRLLCSLLLIFALLAPAGAAAAPLDRGDLAAALWEAQGCPTPQGDCPFSDLPSAGPRAPALAWAAEQGLVHGTGGGAFAPDRPATREEAAVLLRRYARWLGQDAFYPEIARCNDWKDISPWADDSLYWATDTGLILWAEGGLMAPQDTLTAEEVTGIFTRFFH